MQAKAQIEISGLSAIAENYNAMLFDQFGVLHDGEKPYPHAITVLEELKARNIPVAVITNSGKRAEANIARLVKMGIRRELFSACVSSGEIAFQTVKTQAKAYIIGKDNEDYGFVGITTVTSPQEADFLLILGSNAPTTTLYDYRELLHGLKLPAICCNPDKLMLTSKGLQPAPGAIAALYEEMGGKVTWIGKPYPQIYQAAAQAINATGRILCVGDSAEHDVAGGKAAAFDTLLILTGVSQALDPKQLNPQPDHYCSQLVW
jgi:HAD superfamily hydrolase (TIGR01459 family)